MNFNSNKKLKTNLAFLIESLVVEILKEQEDLDTGDGGIDLDLGGGELDVDSSGDGGDLDIGDSDSLEGGDLEGGEDLGDDMDDGGMDFGGGGFGGGGGGFGGGDDLGDGDGGGDGDESTENEDSAEEDEESIPENPSQGVVDDIKEALETTENIQTLINVAKSSIQKYFNSFEEAGEVLDLLKQENNPLLNDLSKRLKMFLMGF